MTTDDSEKKEPSKPLFDDIVGSFNINTTSETHKLQITKKFMNKICESLTLNTVTYDPTITIEEIDKFLTSDEKMHRLLYSELSAYVFKIHSGEKIGIFLTNLEKLMSHITSDPKGQLIIDFDENQAKLREDCYLIALKIYDHFHLSNRQLDKINDVLLRGVKESKDEVDKELDLIVKNAEENINRQIKCINNKFEVDLKNMEKNYITILGIFAAVVLAFVGGITFSSSVLNNIHKASIFRLITVANFLGFSLLNILHLLVSFITEINEKKITLFKIKHLNKIFLWIGIINIIAWLLNTHYLKLITQLK